MKQALLSLTVFVLSAGIAVAGPLENAVELKSSIQKQKLLNEEKSVELESLRLENDLKELQLEAKELEIKERDLEFQLAPAPAVDQTLPAGVIVNEEATPENAIIVEEPEPEIDDVLLPKVVSVYGAGQNKQAELLTPQSAVLYVSVGDSIGGGWKVVGIDRKGVRVDNGSINRRLTFSEFVSEATN